MGHKIEELISLPSFQGHLNRAQSTCMQSFVTHGNEKDHHVNSPTYPDKIPGGILKLIISSLGHTWPNNTYKKGRPRGRGELNKVCKTQGMYRKVVIKRRDASVNRTSQ